MSKKTSSTITLHLFTDGGARGNPGPSAIGIVITGEDGEELFSIAQSIEDGTNNVAEYRALDKGLRFCKKLTRGPITCHSDSELLVRQLNGQYQIRDVRLRHYANRIRKIAAAFEDVKFIHVPRTHVLIRQADRLLNDVLDDEA